MINEKMSQHLAWLDTGEFHQVLMKQVANRCTAKFKNICLVKVVLFITIYSIVSWFTYAEALKISMKQHPRLLLACVRSYSKMLL